MKITSIESYNNSKGFFKIFVDGEYQTSLHKSIIEKFSLKEGDEIEASLLSSLDEAAQVRRARERLLYSLDRRLHSEKELRQKLFRDYPPKIIDTAINELEKLGLVNDRAFALWFAEQRKRVNKQGPYAVVQELVVKGVSRDIAREAVNEIFSDEDEEFSSALAVAEKYKKDLDTPKGKNRLYGALSRRGFGYGVIKKVMQTLCSDLDYFEE